MEKECNKCNISKSLDHFHKDKGKKDGHKNYCKECYKKKIYSYGEKQGEEKRKPYFYEKKGYPKERPDLRKDPSQRAPKYVKKGWNPKSGKQPKPIIAKDGIEGKVCNRCEEWQPLTEYHKHWRYAYGLNLYCKECDLQAKKKYFQTEKGKNNAHRASAKRRSRKKQAKYIPYDRVAILRRDKYTCQICKIKVHDRSTGNWNTPNKAHLDHIISLENGGETREENLQVLCRTCNLEKSAKNKGEVQLALF
jgi:HNH endonuclease